MQRFHPASRPETLPCKVKTTVDEKRSAPPAAKRVILRVAGVLGMDEHARAALERLATLAESRKSGVAGEFMPDDGVGALLAGWGISENLEEADFARFRRVVIPYCGIASRQRQDWENARHPLEDLTSPQVRRAQVALGLLGMEGAQCLVIGRHEDPESLALSGGTPGTRILENTTDTSRLRFSPAFGVVSQTTLSPRRVAWLVEQLRFRYRDSRVTFLDTVAPAMAAREEALEKLLVSCDRVVIVGRRGEASCEALMETALRRGRPAEVVAEPDELKPGDFAESQRVALSAGAFATDGKIRAVAEALKRM